MHEAVEGRRGLAWIQHFGRQPDILLAMGILAVLFVVIVPLPPSLVDPLLILNLTLSVVVLLTAACVSRPLEFSVFPSLLLVTTFLRLALNIATTRLIIGNGGQGQSAAGEVVLTFSGFVAGDNPVSGMIIFLVLVVIQFVVITKGSSRVSEVSARFQLDSMPGKQMSIDGDLAAGFIDQETARDRREEVAQEADFYGAMDGASKFVRGDAVAGLVIVCINLVGGAAIGFLYHGMDLAETAEVFSRLTIGDGLVSQVPALMVSLAAALLVTRSASSRHLGRDLGQQVLSNGRVLSVAALFLVILTPTGLPPFPLLLAAAACGLGAWYLQRAAAELAEDAGVESELPGGSEGELEVAPAAEEELLPTPDDVRMQLRVDPLDIRIGYRLLPLVDASRRDHLTARIAGIRERIALELGLVLPSVGVRDSRELSPGEYCLNLRGNALGRWPVAPSGRLALARRPSAELPEELALHEGPELSGRPSYWVVDLDGLPEDVDEEFEVLRPAEAMARHFEQVVRSHAAEILTREEVSRMLDELRLHSPSLVEDLVPRILGVSELHRVLQELLQEGVSVRDLESILETLGSLRLGELDLGERVAAVRRALARQVCQPSIGPDGRLHVLVLDPALEEFLSHSLERVDGQVRLGLDPQTEASIVDRAAELLSSLERATFRPALLVSPQVRPQLSRMLRNHLPGVSVISYEEVLDENAVEVRGSVSLERQTASSEPTEVNVRR